MLVPTLRVGTHDCDAVRRAGRGAAEDMGSHAERGNQNQPCETLNTKH